MLQRWRDWGRQWVFSYPCNHFSTLRVLYIWLFFFLKSYAEKWKDLISPKTIFISSLKILEVGGNRVFGQSSKNLFEHFLCSSSSSCSYFVSLRVLWYQNECLRVFLFSIVSKFFNINSQCSTTIDHPWASIGWREKPTWMTNRQQNWLNRNLKCDRVLNY